MVPVSLQHLPTMTVAAGSVLFEEKQACPGMPIIDEGVVKVYKTFPNGRELLMYYLDAGQTCTASVACLFGTPLYNARAVAKTSVTMRLVPAELFHACLRDPDFQRFVMVQFAERLSDLMALIDAIVTHRIDQRLAARLLAHGPDCTLTHQQLADELGSVREIVTRIVRQFVDQGWVASERGHIRILQPEPMQRFSQAAS